MDLPGALPLSLDTPRLLRRQFRFAQAPQGSDKCSRNSSKKKGHFAPLRKAVLLVKSEGICNLIPDV